MRGLAAAAILATLMTASIAAVRGARISASVSPSTSTATVFPSSVAAGGSMAATVTVTLRDAGSQPVAGHAVSLSAGSGSSVITTVSGTSDANGHATFTVKDPAAETVTYTAHDNTDSVAVGLTPSEVFAITAVSTLNSSMIATPSSLPVGTSSSMSVTVKDGGNSAVSGQTITVVQDGTSIITGNPQTSNGSGFAGGFMATDHVAGTDLFIALANGIGVKQVSVTFSPGPLDHLRIDPQTASATVHVGQAFTATGLDQYGNGLGDVTSSTTFGITPDGSCVAATCSGDTPGDHTVTGNDGGKTGTATLTVTGPPRENVNVTVSSSPQPRNPVSEVSPQPPGGRLAAVPTKARTRVVTGKPEDLGWTLRARLLEALIVR